MTTAIQAAITNRDIQGLSEALDIFNVVVAHGNQQRVFGDAHLYLDKDQKEIFFPGIGNAITVVDGQWFHICNYGYLRKYEDWGLLHWLEIISCESGRDMSLATLLSGDPKYWVNAMAFWCDHEIPVADPRTIEILVDLLEDPDTFVFLAAVQVLLICAPTVSWEAPELTGDRMAAMERLKRELT